MAPSKTEILNAKIKSMFQNVCKRVARVCPLFINNRLILRHTVTFACAFRGHYWRGARQLADHPARACSSASYQEVFLHHFHLCLSRQVAL